jgi:LacI family transcriptional regulator
VLLALGWYDYRVHRGIEKYASEQHWHVSPVYAREKLIPWGWNGDGILAWLGAGDDLAEFVEKAGKPTVDFSQRRPHLPFPRVLVDYAHGSKLVADHFLDRGFRNFVYYSDADNWGLEERGEGFLAALKASGHGCEWLRWHKARPFRQGRDEWKRKRLWLAARLKTYPKPLAVFAGDDAQALDVLEACESARVAVPEMVAIVGGDNLLLAPESMSTPISSVDPNLELLGYTGAGLLDKLMKGEAAPKKPIRIPAARLIVRQSSDLLAVNHKGLSASLRYIMENCHKPIHVANLVAVAAMSRRSLHQAFLEILGRTPGQELQRARIERAKDLLVGTDHKMDAIAEMCGFASSNSFFVAFKQAVRVSPKQYRQTHSPTFRSRPDIS